MNRDLLQKTMDSYAEKFETMNSPENHEIFKWTAVSNFQKYWDIDAADFGKMFEKALSESENLVDDDLTQPSHGIQFLCEKDGETMERVRDAFRELLAPDHSDYKKRQKKIETFVDTINQMLEEAGDDEWSHRQSMRSGISYLAFIEPDDNFFYREAEEKAFARYIKYSGKIGSGKSFSLKSYYTLCGEIVSALGENEDLLTMVQNELERESDRTGDSAVTDIDGENHILAFDLMYGMQNYGFYDEQAAVRRKSSRSSLASGEKEKKLAELGERKKNLQRQIDEIREKLESASLPDLTGQTVTHKKFGNGRVSSQEERRITVVFESAEKKFVLPAAIVRGFLKPANPEEEQAFQLSDQLEKELEKQERELHIVDLQISQLQ